MKNFYEDTEGVPSPGESLPSGGEADPSSPDDSSPSDPDETKEALRELRSKIAAQGEDNKSLRQALEALHFQNQQLMAKTPADNGNTVDIEGLAAKVIEEATTENLTALLQAHGEKLTSALREEIRQLKNSRDGDNASSVSEKFFESKGLPEMAKPGSRFFTFVQNEVNSDRAMKSLWSSGDYEAALEWSWGKYTSRFGDPTKRDVERKRAASLSDAPGAGNVSDVNVDAILRKLGPGKRPSMLEIDKIIRQTTKR